VCHRQTQHNWGEFLCQPNPKSSQGYQGSNSGYFPSPEFEQSVRPKADREISAAAFIVTQAAENADIASKSAIAAAVACKYVVAETMKFTAMQRETASTQNA